MKAGLLTQSRRDAEDAEEAALWVFSAPSAPSRLCVKGIWSTQ
jgi:hypothetical protein